MSQTPFFIATSDAPAKQRILQEGLRLFARKGLSETTIRDIGKAAGYTNPALYKHFSSKEALASYLFVTCYQEQVARLDKALHHTGNFPEALGKYLRAMADFYDTSPEAMMFLADNLATLWPGVPDTMKSRTVITLTREMLRHGRKEGAVSKSHPLELQVALVTGTLAQISRQIFLGSMKGPAKRHTTDLEKLLSSALR